MNSIFEIASRKKYRYPYKGSISTEDLWDLNLEQLDGVYKALCKADKAEGEASLLAEHAANLDLQRKIDIVKYIFMAKQDEADKRKAEAQNAEKRKRILDVLAQKQDESLRNMSQADLQKMLDELN